MLPGIARGAIAAHLGMAQRQPLPAETWLDEAGACFVTLHRHGTLRGCIGSLVARRPLGEDVVDNAIAAAFRDPRFPPLSRDEFPEVDIEVSVLSAPEEIFPASEAALMAMLKPGVDGLILEYGIHRATFLPQVWGQLPDAGRFLAHLKQKAGLPANFWHPDMRFSRYGVQSFSESTEGVI